MNPAQPDILLTARETREIAVTFGRLDDASNIWIDLEGDGSDDDTLQMVPYSRFGEDCC